ncbi:MAG: NodS [Tardiphaga sp.]|jgi:2-polyprenyl-3-methyl-5-hydroxy-6-metoxy-1,4-benzoquinol methylase|nr:NodS [Tardiphaga sp.]
MNRKNETIPPNYFEDKYRANIDPWQFRSSDYEKQKYQATIGALRKSRYAHALEVGCSIGVLTSLLAQRCDSVLAIDASTTAIAAARQTSLGNVTFEVATLPQNFPTGQFDLIMLSEVLYYFTEVDLKRVTALCLEALRPSGEIILCHWLGTTDYPLPGQTASDLFAAAVSPRLTSRVCLRDDVYRLERFCEIGPAFAAAAR